ncbi:MAG: nucleotidyltransferase domain-containing protein [Phycisphaerae bacterium]|nr:nucleotidyltransferase domain-containing protein [Phycisphaerae bacterium]
MLPLIDQHRAELTALCRRYHVARLDVFGSAATGEFDPARSDLDFLVEFRDLPAEQRFDTFFELQRALSELFGRPVDLVEADAPRNPYFLRRLNESRRPVYAA